MIIDNLKQAVENNRGVTKPLYIRNVLKEEIQNYVLNYVYNSPDYQDLIFTGGTCLRKIYDLPRLSEDLDFDYTGSFDIGVFADDIKKYFASDLQYKKITTKISGNKNTVYIKLPILKELGLTDRDEVLFVRCDFYPETLGEYETEINSISTPDFTFFARSYDLSTLFANKLYAFISRDFFKGNKQTVAFKARDIFDLVWFLEKSKKSGWELSPNWGRLTKAKDMERNDIIRLVIDKVETIDENEIKHDLNPFIQSDQSVDQLSRVFKDIIKKGMSEYLV